MDFHRAGRRVLWFTQCNPWGKGISKWNYPAPNPSENRKQSCRWIPLSRTVPFCIGPTWEHFGLFWGSFFCTQNTCSNNIWVALCPSGDISETGNSSAVNIRDAGLHVYCNETHQTHISQTGYQRSKCSERLGLGYNFTYYVHELWAR